MRKQLRFEVYETSGNLWGWKLFNCKDECVAISAGALGTKEQAHREVQSLKGNSQRAKVIERPMVGNEA